MQASNVMFPPQLQIMQLVSHTSIFCSLLMSLANYQLQKLLREGVSIMRLMDVK